jgi:hypothetical protein
MSRSKLSAVATLLLAMASGCGEPRRRSLDPVVLDPASPVDASGSSMGGIAGTDGQPGDEPDSSAGGGAGNADSSGAGETGGGPPADGAAAACGSDRECPAGAPLCLEGRCSRCGTAEDCQGPTRAAACDLASGRCVECTDSALHCQNEGKPFCRDNVCVGCQAAGARACAGARPACDVESGRCVECLASTDCGLAEAVCNTEVKTCGPCRSDGQCSGKSGGPGVCMFHQDGRCASDAEALYVSSRSGCGSGSGAGSAVTPLCTVQAAVDALTLTRRVLIIRGVGVSPGFSWSGGGPQLSVIGQDGATIFGGNDVGIAIAGGDLYIRDLTVNGAQVGIVARPGATLRLERVIVKDNQAPAGMYTGGGIFIDGAGFDIRNCLISGNGPGVDFDVVWGGLLVRGSGTPRRLERVSVVGNLETGVVCAAMPIIGIGLFTRNPGQVEITPTCRVRPCPSPSETCGSDLQP